jgi:hypothetical protein
MTNAEIPIGRQAVGAWKRLDAGVRKDVWRRARQGLGHPDPAVAAIAIGRAHYTLSRSFAVWYWGPMFVMITGVGLGLAALLNRLGSPDRALYVIVVIVSFSSGIMNYTKLRRDAKQLEEANMNTFRTGHTDHGSLD